MTILQATRLLHDPVSTKRRADKNTSRRQTFQRHIWLKQEGTFEDRGNGDRATPFRCAAHRYCTRKLVDLSFDTIRAQRKRPTSMKTMHELCIQNGPKRRGNACAVDDSRQTTEEQDSLTQTTHVTALACDEANLTSPAALMHYSRVRGLRCWPVHIDGEGCQEGEWGKQDDTLMKPMSLAISLNDCLLMLRPYLRMMPQWLPLTRLQRQ